MKNLTVVLLIVSAMASPLFSAYYVSPEGSDLNSGTYEAPFITFSHAISLVQPGDSIIARGGTYALSAKISISGSKSGTDSTRIYWITPPGERALLDFTASSFGEKGIDLKASYWTICGLDVKGAGDNGLQISGWSHNVIENCSFFEHRDTGLQINSGAAYNHIINCDSYYNADPEDYGDADGFAAKLDVGTGNYFYGCRAWGNCDDGWDGYLRGADDITTVLEHCWTWGNGYLKDGSDPGDKANGNGFKMGGGDNSNSEKLMHHFILKNCIAFDNKGKGFDQNNNVGSMTLLNCTGFRNKVSNFRIQKALVSGQILNITNCVSYSGLVELGSFALQTTNSWLGNLIVNEEDFLSLDTSSADDPRNVDFSLPEIDFLHLASGSDLIDAGTIIADMPYFGTGPDLGAFESTFTGIVALNDGLPNGFRLNQNYPNPFNPSTTISFSLDRGMNIRLNIYNLTGQKIGLLSDGYHAAGNHEILWQPENLPSGVYLCRLETAQSMITKRLILKK